VILRARIPPQDTVAERPELLDRYNASVPSKRLPPDLGLNALARAWVERGDVPLDLTLSNPTSCGIEYPPDLLAPLGDRRGLAYGPEALGLFEARQAVADHYRARGIEVDTEHVVLAASTSEAYGFLFKLLGDPGDEVRIPTPSYPLLHHLVALEGLRPIPYRLVLEDDWQPDLDVLPGEHPKVVVAVHPNNPTGSFLSLRSADTLIEVCSRAGAALVVDEVFLDYPLDERGGASSFARESRSLTFCLGGLSKLVGLPQLKLSWIVVSGPEDERRRALDGLAFIADQYLSVSTPVQLALPHLLECGEPIRQAILARCRRNLDALERAAADVAGVSVLRPHGGWSVVVRVPAVRDDEELAIELVRQDGVAVHPGYLFDFPSDGFFVVSLLPEPPVFDTGVARFLDRCRT
jgi:alanine-synthesizing transaminase